MQVERQSSPWPAMIVLAILVAFCLTAPRHWSAPAHVADHELRTAPSSQFGPQRSMGFSSSYMFFPVDWKRQTLGFGDAHLYGAPWSKKPLDHDLLSLWPAPTIDELVAERIGMSNLDSGSVGSLPWQFTAASNRSGPQQTEPKATDGRSWIVEPLMSTAFGRIGQMIATHGPETLLPQLSAHAARAYQILSTLPLAPEASNDLSGTSVHVVGPNEGLATRSQEEDIKELPVVVPGEGGSPLELEVEPWCVPQLLLDQLQRIARHEECRAWAERTIDHLQVLTARKSLDGNDVSAVLAALNTLSNDAKRLAESVGDDRLRVELLRAHWALTRRLDRWSVMYEIRTAARAGERVAARGSLDAYFDGMPEGSPTPIDELALQLERYEEIRDPQLGRRIVSEKRTLEGSSNALDRAMADAVEQHYRNANVRVAISAAMLNRYVGREKSETRALRDRIGGATVRGQSHVQSASRVKLDPATGRWAIDVQSEGTILSNAMANAGQARFRSRTSTDFSARKRIIVDAQGVLLRPASVNVDSNNRLLGVSTEVDWLPLVSSYARDRAVREYRARQHRAKTVVESKVAAEAVSTIDGEAQEAVARIERKFCERITQRLGEFGVQVTPVELTTTHERVVARLRIASDEQPGSHTPRPRALSDSLASVQIHETALTNSAVSLELDGKRYTADELAALFQKKFPQAKTRKLDEERRNTVFQFAKQDAVQFHVEDGQLELTISLASVELDGDRMRNFVVHAFYVPVVHGMEAELVRDGALGIEGRLGSGDRARLHNVFNSVLPPERKLPLVRLDDANEPRLAGLTITQLVLEDGWIGLAIGPGSSERIAERSRSLR